MKLGIKIGITLLTLLPTALLAERKNALNTEPSTRARMGEIESQQGFHDLIDQSAEVYSAVTKTPQGEVPATVLKNVRCIAVLPTVMTGALVIGGTHGNGLASCRDSNNAWSQPAAISLNQASIGVQAGAKATDLVLFFQSEEAVAALKRGDFAIGTDVSAVAGKYDRSFDTSKAGIVAYTRTEGVFAGASLTGGKIGKNDKDTETYYGKKVEYASLLEGKQSPDDSNYADKLTKLFP